MVEFHAILRKEQEVFLYGAGDYGHIFLRYINNIGYNANAFVISDLEDINKFCNDIIPVYKISELPLKSKECCFILCMTEDKQIQVRNVIKDMGVEFFLSEKYDNYEKLINYIKESNFLYENGYL